MRNPLILKLEQFTAFSAEDKQSLRELSASKVRSLSAKEDVIREGDKPHDVNLILEGWACRYKILEDGRRAISAFMVPGDLCDVRMFILKQMDHSIGSLTPLIVAQIPSERLLELADSSTRICRALWWNSLVEEAIAREWASNIGQRDVLARLAHLFCEMFFRLQSVGLADHDTISWPLTQSQLGEAVGASTVHVNRSIQELRDRNLVELSGRKLHILNLDGLKDLAMFSASYLHRDRDGQSLDANDG